MTELSFTTETTDYINTLSLEDRKKLGQYMTPNFLGQKMAELLTKYMPTTTGSSIKVLDPAVGTGELLRAFGQTHASVPSSFYGFDIDEGMLDTAQKNIPGITTVKKSIFDEIGAYSDSFDFIIGNPPYFEIKKDSPELSELDFETKTEAGRLNMFALFFEYSLKLLKPNGVMVFLVPPSMNNGAYFKKTREYILKNATIEHLEIVRHNKHFADALTSVQIIVLRKKENSSPEAETNSNFVVDFNSLSTVKPVKPLPIIFTEKKAELLKLWENNTSLANAGFKVKTGNIVWNQFKSAFASEPKEGYSPLLYSKDIKNNTLDLNPALSHKRWLPTTEKCLTVPSIIVNRIVGSLSNPQLKYALIEKDSYFTENHVNVITFTGETGLQLPKLQELTRMIDKSKEWLPSYLQAVTGNTQISSTELLNLIPFVPKSYL